MRTILVAAAAACLAAAPAVLLKPDAALEGEMAVPALALGAGVRLDAKPLVAGWYADRPGDGELRRAAHEAQVLLWASSAETPPSRLRAEVLKARAKHGIPAGLLKAQYAAPKTVPMTNAFKAGLFATNRELARLSAKLEQQVEALEALADAREKGSPRWQANADWLTACLLLRLAHLDEFALQIGEMRKEFPDRDPAKHRGWRLEPSEDVRDAQAKRRVKAARRLLDRLAEEHGGTPWAEAARRLAAVPLSAAWRPE
ncbi:MAG: hypothetical protein ACRC33_11610 [Gemmataceae bacterium]